MIHSLGTSLFSFAGLETARLLEVPFVVNVHGLMSDEVLFRRKLLKGKMLLYKLLSFYYRKLEKKIFTNSYVITFSNLEKQNILLRIDEDIPLTVIYHGCDHVPKISDSPKNGVAYIKPTLRKGVDFFLKIAPKLTDITFNVYAAETIKTNGNIKIYGYISDFRQFYSLLSRQNIIIHPSRHDSFSISTLEAMRLGLFPVVSENTGVCEIIEKHGSGIVLPLKEELWVEVIRNLEVSDEMRRNIVNTASRYTWKKALDEHIEVYKTLLK